MTLNDELNIQLDKRTYSDLNLNYETVLECQCGTEQDAINDECINCGRCLL